MFHKQEVPYSRRLESSCDRNKCCQKEPMQLEFVSVILELT
uniref:Uncharacterized protein n=1 Tax=Arundo donax TaxID=35708 RepID=A0A0A9B8V0_ARUDO